MRYKVRAEMLVDINNKNNLRQQDHKIITYLKSHLDNIAKNKMASYIKGSELTLGPDLVIDKIFVETEIEVPSNFLVGVQNYLQKHKITFQNV